MGQANPGPQGPQGPLGPLGPQGPSGPLGSQGIKGDIGPQGPIGLTGPIGLQGIQGVKGETGSQGFTGPIGLTGPIGPVGPVGSVGPQGAGYNVDTELNSIKRSTGDWLRITGTPTSGTALFNGLSINDGGGLAVGKFQHVPQGQLQVEGIIRPAAGFGPYSVRFYNNNKCLDAGQMVANANGGYACDNNNTYQQFSYNPVSGHVKHLASNKCLDTMGDTTWVFGDCNNHQNQRFFMAQNGLKSVSSGDCLNIGNANHHWPCDTNDTNEQLVFDLI